MVLPVVREMGRQCPVGAEIELLMGVEVFWPNFRSHPQAVAVLFEGFAERPAVRPLDIGPGGVK